MEKRESRKNQNHFPCRLLPLQNLKSDVKFCSLAELKTCLDSAQINSFQKESKDSILKLLKCDTSSLDGDRRCYSLWKSTANNPSNSSKDNKEKRKLEKPQQPCQSRTVNDDAQIKMPKSGVTTPQKPKTAPKFLNKTVTRPIVDSAYEEPLQKFVHSTISSHYQDDVDSSNSSVEEEEYSENAAMSAMGEFSSEFDYRFEDANDEFDELSDLDADGDDSAVVSRCNSSLSWTSLDNKQDEVSESVTTTDSGLGSDADISTHLPITHSLFKHCPAVLYFPSEHEKLSKLPRALQKQLKWKMSNITPNVVKNIISRAGFVASTKRREWIGYWGKHMKASAFKNIHPHQKVNHFPGTFEIGRKDKLWKNLYKAQIKHSKKEFDFVPLTFCLPTEWKTFKRYWDESGHKQKWIVKPPASARGIGIKVIHKLNQIPRKRNVIIQRYLSNPYLINGRKFDLRIYVYVSSYDPLCIYIYDNGLVRFASSKYSHSTKTLSNRYMHLTNYSVNKNNEAYIKNEDESGTDSHKWGLKALWKYLLMAGQDVDALKSKIKNIIIKVIISSVPTVTSLSKSNCKYRHTCHELFGFDIFLDHHLKPWLIEVNISPSLHTSAPLDKHIKSGLIKDLFNTAGFQVPILPTRSKSTAPTSQQGTSSLSATGRSGHQSVEGGGSSKHDGTTTPVRPIIAGGKSEAGTKENVESVTDSQLYFNPGICLSSDEKAKHAYFSQKFATDATVVDKIIDTLTPDDMRVIMKFEDEASRSGELELVFPAENSVQYLKYFQFAKYYDLLVIHWIKKNAKDPQRGTSRLQKLSETKVQFATQPSTAEHVWCKQNFRNMKRFEKMSERRKKIAPIRIEEVPSIRGSTHYHKDSTKHLLQDTSPNTSLDMFVKKGVSPITYKPPLPEPVPTHRRPVQAGTLARNQPGTLAKCQPGPQHDSGSARTPYRTVHRPPRPVKTESRQPSQSRKVSG